MVDLSTSLQNKTQLYAEFVAELKRQGFSGRLEQNEVELLLASFDNSVYQVKPYVIIFPKSKHDIQIILSCANQKEFLELTFAVRGGGTSTVGQSLHSGCIIDLQRYFNQVVRLDIKEKQVTVTSGMVLERLNEHLRSVGMRFPVAISSACAATIGGMVNTDAAGVGSYCLGRMHDHVLAIRGYLIDGSKFYINKTSKNSIYSQATVHGLPAEFYRRIYTMVSSHKEKISELFTKTNRTLTGYNLNNFIIDQEYCSLIPILCGSEGTLAIITEVTLAIEKTKPHRKLLVIGYKEFIHSTTDLEKMLQVKPDGIEAMDGNLINAARSNAIIYEVIKKYFSQSHDLLQGLSLVEFIGDDMTELDQRMNDFCNILSDQDNGSQYHIIEDEFDIARFWNVRKKSVGIMGSVASKGRRPIAFIEDSAVPLQHLRPYIIDMQKLFQKYDLIFGIYGHLDSGCLHVRPALDLSQHLDQDLFKKLLQQVLDLVEKYSGNFRAEHGYGFLSKFNKDVLGDEIFHLMCNIKSIFDPANRLNPGKVALVDKKSSDLIDCYSHWYAEKYSVISKQDRNDFSATIACNGNSSCLNQQKNSLICPSYQVTHDMRFSPRGRAIMFREWLLNRNDNSSKRSIISYIPGLKVIFKPISLYKLKKKNNLEWQLYKSMQGCLSCNACVTQCPVKVAIPKARDEFIHYFRSNYVVSLRMFFFSYIEWLSYFFGFMPFWFKRILNSKMVTSLFAMFLGLTEVPRLSDLSLRRSMKELKVLFAKPNTIVNDTSKHIVVIVPDIFSSFYHTEIIVDCMKLFNKLGVSCYMMPFLPSGKSAKVVGDIVLFKKHAKRFVSELSALHNVNKTIQLVCIEPSIALFFRSDYKDYSLLNNDNIKILLLQEYLCDFLSQQGGSIVEKKCDKLYYLLSHCHEKSLLAESDDLWVKVFKMNGINLHKHQLGCCGMAGFYGLQKNNYAKSKMLYEKSYSDLMSNRGIADYLVSTGFSCREQIERFSNISVKHPVQVLYRYLIST